MIIGVLVAAASLFAARRRVRRGVTVGLVVLAIVIVGAFPLVSHWFLRGQSATLFSDLTGRTVVWGELLNAPRDKVQVLFGSGLSNKSFQGLSIDNAWLAAYQDQGLIGDMLIGLSLLGLLVTALLRPRGPARALALFFVTYGIISSFTEAGLGDASTFVLDLIIAASLLMPPASWNRGHGGDHTGLKPSPNAMSLVESG
jgi:hypothetical protein